MMRLGMACGLVLLALMAPAQNAWAQRARVRPAAARTQPPADELPRLYFVAPGTRIENQPPPGWSHLVLKSVPRLSSGDLDSMPDSGRETASMFRNVILADVRPSPADSSAYVLRRVGVGVCTPDHGHDMVVSTRTAAKLGIDLGTIGRIVLDRTEKEMALGKLVARTPTFTVFRSPVLLLAGGAHRRVLLNYALAVDPKSGSLRTALWWVDSEPSDRRPARQLELLSSAPLIFTCDLDVVARRLFGEIPVSWSVAMRTLPPGKAFAMPPSLARWTVTDPVTFEDAAALEREVRKALP